MDWLLEDFTMRKTPIRTPVDTLARSEKTLVDPSGGKLLDRSPHSIHAPSHSSYEVNINSKCFIVKGLDIMLGMALLIKLMCLVSQL